MRGILYSLLDVITDVNYYAYMIIRRMDALDLGLNRFFTGLPCSKGHVSERITGTGSCVVCYYGEFRPSKTYQRRVAAIERRIARLK